MGQLLLHRHHGESIVIDHDIRVTVLESKGGTRLAIDAPRSVQVDREEVYEAKYPEGAPDDGDPMVSGLVDSVAGFMEIAGQPLQDTPALPSEDRRQLRQDLLTEEFREYCEAESADEMTEIADALGDMMVIIAGTALEYGIPLDEVLAEIMRSNHDKFPGGKVTRRDDGKILKPEGWTPPDVEGVLERHTHINEKETA